MVNNSFSQSKKDFGRLRKFLVCHCEKNQVIRYFLCIRGIGEKLLVKNFNTSVSPASFVKFLRKKYLLTFASESSQVILFTMHEKDTASKA